MATNIEPVVEPLAPTTETVVEPVAGAPAPAESAPEAGLPDEILRVPAFQALFAGAPPALSAPIKGSEKRPEAKLVMDNKDALMQAGIGLYRSLGGDLGVLFNQMYIHPAELQAADKAGKLLEVAPPIDSVNGEVAKSGKNNPVMNAKTPSGPKTAPVPAPPQFSSGGGLPASSEAKLTSARVKNLTPGAPTSGPAPGAGRVFNAIFKPTI
jgi:hypothetical protein